MTIIYIAIIVFQVGVIIYFVRRGRKQKKEVEHNNAIPADDTYEGRRHLALNVTPGQLKLNIPDTQTLVYGVVMEWNTGESVIALAAYITGAANLYISTGGGLSGGGKKPNVGEAAVRLVTAAQEFLGRAMPVNDTEYPPIGCTRFYLLTNKQIYAAQEQVKYFDDGSSPWLSLFEQGNEVIAEMKN